VTHPIEAALVAYVDGGLDDARLREVEEHLMGCRGCRGRVVALENETIFLSDALAERERKNVSSVPTSDHGPVAEPPVAFSVPLTVLSVGIGLGMIGFLLESRFPAGLDLLHPMRLKGASEMAFDLVFFLRDSVPGLVELGISIGVLASVSGLLTFGVGLVYRRVFGTTAALVALAALATPQPAAALVVALEEDTRVAAGETVEESMILSGDLVRIDGTVVGDVAAGAEHVQITGRIDGNLYVFTRDLEISGTVEGTVIALAERARIDGTIRGAAHLGGERVTLAGSGKIERDLWSASERTDLEGSVGRDLLFAGERLDVGGNVGRSVEVRMARDVTLRDGARIGGDVDAWFRGDRQVEQAPGAEVAGEVRNHERERGHDSYLAAYRNPAIWAAHILTFAAAFGFGLLIYSLLPGLFDVGIATSRDFFRALGNGFVLLVVPPLAIAAVALTLVGIPAAVLGLFIYVVALYTAELLVGAWLGRLLAPQRDGALLSFGRSLLVGFGLITIATHVPFVGPPIGIVCMLTGLGLLWQRARRLPMFA
jgi:cytoskeletal protein CcmA (bactofilin family)